MYSLITLMMALFIQECQRELTLRSESRVSSCNILPGAVAWYPSLSQSHLILSNLQILKYSILCVLLSLFFPLSLSYGCSKRISAVWLSCTTTTAQKPVLHNQLRSASSTSTMAFSTLFQLALFLSITLAVANASGPGGNKFCASGYEACSAAGQKTSTVPQIGPAISSLYVDLLQAISGVSKRGVEEPAAAQSSLPVCCTSYPSLHGRYKLTISYRHLRNEVLAGRSARHSFLLRKCQPHDLLSVR